jgi:hypothetical protein
MGICNSKEKEIKCLFGDCNLDIDNKLQLDEQCKNIYCSKHRCAYYCYSAFEDCIARCSNPVLADDIIYCHTHQY